GERSCLAAVQRRFLSRKSAGNTGERSAGSEAVSILIARHDFARNRATGGTVTAQTPNQPPQSPLLCLSTGVRKYGDIMRNHKDVARQSRNQNPSRELRESSVAAVYFFEAARCRACASRTADDVALTDRRRSRSEERR